MTVGRDLAQEGRSQRMAKLAGSKAVVTGAGSGIGRAIARALVDRGASVVLADIDGEAVAWLASELGPGAAPLQLDVTDHTAVDRLLGSIPAAFRPIDILINNAGHDVGGRTHFARGSADDWTSIIDTNLTGMMRVTRAVLPEMVERSSGDIVNMSSISALRLVPDTAAYTTSKAGVRAFSDALRADLAETPIRVTEVLPGLTRTNIILKRHRGDQALEKAYFDQARIALDPEDISRAIIFALEQPPHMQIAQLYILPVNRW
jgi:3-hydroxy acid dehydrogenase / malonic semialdehyde reductase